MAGARAFWMLLLGRTLTGFAGGLTAACIPVYLSEIAPPGVRGALGATPQLMAVFGSLSLYALGLLLPWRWLAVAGEGPVVVMILLLSFMPNSPRFLLSRGRDAEALQALAWLRGTQADIRWEFQQIQDNVQRQSSRMSWAEARDPHMYRPIAIAVLMRFLQQLTGITPVLVYLQPIFTRTAVLLPPQDDAAIVGAVRLFAVMIAALTMDRAGRKVLLFVSASIMFAANVTLGLYIHFGPKPEAPNNTVGLESVPLGGAEQPLATPTSFLTLVPLLATMLFITERLRPAGAFLLLRRHLLAEPGVHRLLRARDQGPLAGADRVLLPDREEVLPAVGQRPPGAAPWRPGLRVGHQPEPRVQESNLPPAGDSTASSTDPQGAPPGTRQPAAPAALGPVQQPWPPTHQPGPAGRGGSQVPQGSTAQDWGPQATLGNLRPSCLLTHGGCDEDRRLEAEEWLRAPGCHPAPGHGEEGGKLHPRAG